VILGATVAKRTCPTGCSRSVREGHLMCPGCWREVPNHLQAEVHRTWRRWRRDLGNAELMKAYREAADHAVGSIA
jgi:hypothetical protein